MNKYIYNILRGFSLVALAIAPMRMNAQKSHLDHLAFTNIHNRIVGDSIELRFAISLEELRLSRQDFMSLTPVITSIDGAHTMALPPVHQVGRTRALIWERAERFKRPHIIEGTAPLYSSVFGKNSPKTIEYHTLLPYEGWMNDARLSIVEEVTGCAECTLSHTDKTLESLFIYQPDYKLSYIVPAIEPVKSRADRYAATVNFRVNDARLERNYKNNQEVLDDVKEKVAEIINNKDLTVSDIEIIGYASPEATVDYNKSLAERRSAAIADYLSEVFGISRQRMKVSGYGEDWDMTRSEVAASTIADKDEILRIIDTIEDPDARDPELKKLSGGTTYATLLEQIYPRIRRTEYSLSYVVRGFDLEEAKQVFKQNPKLLSLNEMFLIAQTYDPDSKAFKEVFEVARRLFPDDPVAIINAATTQIEAGQYDQAIKMLSRVEGDPRAWNPLAVAYAYTRQYDQAMTYLVRAQQQGASDTVLSNLEELRHVLSDQGIEL